MLTDEEREHFMRPLARHGFAGQLAVATPYILPPVVPIPGGRFVMGSRAKRDPDAFMDERPHPVELPAYTIARFPVTVAEYALAVRAGVVAPPPLAFATTWGLQLARPNHPVVCVRWHEACAYAAWLTAISGVAWRLVREAEWEFAARGSDGRIFPWGDGWDERKANTADGGPQGTSPVDHYPQGASPFGVWDLAGNCWEWTSSRYRPYPYRADDGREDLSGDQARVVRGSSWYHAVRALSRSAARCAKDPDRWYMDVGFRLARD